MRMLAVQDCLRVLRHFDIDPAVGEAIDVGGTHEVYLVEGDSARTTTNPLLEIHPRLTLLDRGFNAERFETEADVEIDFLDPAAIAPFREKFDRVFCFDTLEHVANPFRFCDHLV